MSFLRQFRDTQPDTTEWKTKQIVENVIGVLATSPDGKHLWRHNNPCPLKLLPALYAQYVSRWPGVNSDIKIAIRDLGFCGELEEWLSGFYFFKIIDGIEGRAVIYSPLATDVMVECYYQHHKFCVCFEDIAPSLNWSKCPVCGQNNSYEHLKYSIICSATGDLISKWCEYFHNKSVVVPNRETSDYVSRSCACCPFIDCPYAWGIAENHGKGKNKPKMVSFLLPQNSMQRYADFPSVAKFIEKLGAEAEEELWGPEFEYLRMYIYLTFYFQLMRRSQNAGLIETIHHSWFNTGLQSRNTGEDIFVCFKPGNKRWHYVGLTWKGAPNGLYDEFRCVKGMIPEYVPPYENISELFWDTKLSLNWQQNFEHMYFDNLNRILTCKSFRNGLSGITIPPEYKEKVDKHYDIKLPNDPQFREAEKESAFYKAVYALFERSVKLAERMLRSNYKWILPIYFPRNRSMSLALPLFLNSDGRTKEPDLALVCTRRKDGENEYYDARTIFEGYMIYKNARQVCKPFAEWVSALLDDDFIGTVISVRPKFGFIRSDNGRPLWFSMLDNQCVADILRVGDRVKFEFLRNEKGWVAVNVRLVQENRDKKGGRGVCRNNEHLVASSIGQPSHTIGRVERISSYYGFIRSREHNQIYFSRKANCNVFDSLYVGARVVFTCKSNDSGFEARNIVIDEGSWQLSKD